MKNLFTFLSFYFIFFNAPAPKIYTVAGFSNVYGDGRDISRAAIYEPHGITADSKGNVYYTEIYNHTLCRMDTNKVVTVIAGKRYQPGFCGDGMRATEALLNNPAGITTDSEDNIYFADQGNHCIRKVDKAGIIHTIAGNGVLGYSGDGGDALHASLNKPQDVALDKQGNLYIADAGSECIRKVDAHGIITTYAGNGIKGFSGDSGLAVHASLNNPQAVVVTKEGNLTIADCDNNRIRLVNSITGIITTIAGTGKYPSFCSTGDKSENGMLATDANIGEPTDVDVDSTGVLYIAESYACNISTVNAAGTFNRLNAYAESVYKLTVNKKADQLYFTTTNEDDCWGLTARIDQYNLANKHQKSLLFRASSSAFPDPNSANKHFATLASFYPNAIGFDHYNNMYVAENYTVKKINTHGLVTAIAGSGYLENAQQNGDGGSALNAKFADLVAIAIDKKGNIYLADNDDARIRKIDTKGIITTIAGNSGWGYTPDGQPAVGNPMDQPYDVGVDESGTVYYATAKLIRKIDKNGLLVTIAGGDNKPYDPSKNNVPAKDASVNYCTGLYIDNKEKSIYYTEFYGSTVRKIDSTGIVNTVAGTYSAPGFAGDGGLAVNARLNGAYDVTKDHFGNVYIEDKNSQRIRRVTPDGMITTIAGTGTYEAGNCDGEWYYYGVYSGDGDSAAKAAVNLGSYDLGYYDWSGITTDKEGNLYIAEGTEGRVRELAINCKQQPAPFYCAAKQYINKNTSLSYGCNLICSVQPYGNLATALNSVVIASVWVQDTPVHNKEERTFASRYYKLSPEKYASGATADITLYYLQSEFDAYNKAASNAFTKLPTQPNDTAGIANISILIANGSGNDTTGLPDIYTSRSKIIHPATQNVQWNDSLHCWQITINANGFGGYFLSTDKTADKHVIVKKDIIINPSHTSVFPNPATAMTTINCTPDLLNTTYILTDAAGRIILNNKITALTQTLDVSALKPGIYLIMFRNNDVKKIIKY